MTKFNKGAQTNPNYKSGTWRNPNKKTTKEIASDNRPSKRLDGEAREAKRKANLEARKKIMQGIRDREARNRAESKK
jgi:hypothetical protein